MKERDTQFDRLYILSKDRLFAVASKMSIARECVQNYLDAMESDNGEMRRDELHFVNFLMVLVAGRKDPELFDFSPIVREIQAISNHMPFAGKVSEKTTSLFQKSIEEERSLSERHVPKDLDAFIEQAYKCHLAVDEFYEQQKASLQKSQKKIESFLKEDGEKKLQCDDDYAKHYDDLDFARCTVHHVLDKFLQEDPFRTYKKDPNKVAVIAILLMEQFNRYLSEYFHTAEKRELALFGGWKNPSGLSSVQRDEFLLVGWATNDAGLLIANPDDAKDGWEEIFLGMFPEDEVDRDEYIPRIKLKYCSDSPDDESVCSLCEKPFDIAGFAYADPASGQQHFMCEPCAVEKMLDDEHFAEHLIDYSKRKRMFEVTYLFGELVIDRYMSEYNIFSVETLPQGKMQELIRIAMESYNTFFTREEKIAFEVIRDQKELEMVLKESVQKIRLLK